MIVYQDIYFSEGSGVQVAKHGDNVLLHDNASGVMVEMNAATFDALIQQYQALHGRKG